MFATVRRTIICAVLLILQDSVFAQTSFGLKVLITQSIDDSKLITLKGNTHPQARQENDRGRVPDSFAMQHMVLQLKRAAEQQAELEKLVESLHNPSSPLFHKWLTAEQIGSRFGPAQQDLDAVKEWLGSNGFTVNVVFPSKTAIDFSGTAGQVKRAFHTEMHYLRLKGERHIANMSDPQIPAALEPAIAGIVALHDIRPQPMRSEGGAVSNEDFGTGRYMAPGDLAVIYNFNPLFEQGVSGEGQTIVVLESSDLYSTGDWYAFRRVFGLTKRYPAGTLTEIHPGSRVYPCDDPGPTIAADREATTDAEWASAAAPNANIVVASCATGFDWGYFIAMRNLLNSPNPPAVMSLSYGGSEAGVSAAENASVYSLYLQAAAEGVSIFVSAGDWGADSFFADRGTASQHGMSVNAFASTPYNVAVGGTDFEDVYFGQTNTYWNTTNTFAFASAKSYVPEIAWNGSCASQLVANYYDFARVYGSDSFCNSPSVPANFLTGLAGSGGPSSCASGRPVAPGVVSGSCSGYPKPAWQNVLGNPNDGVRDLPDVALFASLGGWGHSYLLCFSDPARNGIPCSTNFQTSGGTSAAAPVMAGIQALINQKTGQSWGNPNPVYYALARDQYGSSGSAACNASLGNMVGADCTFYDITQGDNVVICQPGSPNCYAPSGTYGVMSLSTTSFQPAYTAGVGWDFTTGIGSVNAYNLVTNWSRGVTLSAQSATGSQ